MKTLSRYETKFLRSYALLEMNANTHGTKKIKSSSSSLIDWTNISKIKLVAKNFTLEVHCKRFRSSTLFTYYKIKMECSTQVFTWRCDEAPCKHGGIYPPSDDSPSPQDLDQVHEQPFRERSGAVTGRDRGVAAAAFRARWKVWCNVSWCFRNHRKQ